jgi:hypothetical protein
MSPNVDLCHLEYFQMHNILVPLQTAFDKLKMKYQKITKLLDELLTGPYLKNPVNVD